MKKTVEDFIEKEDFTKCTWRVKTSLKLEADREAERLDISLNEFITASVRMALENRKPGR